MGSCAAPSAKGDDKFITTDYLQQCLIEGVESEAHKEWLQGMEWFAIQGHYWREVSIEQLVADDIAM
jgi:EAL domain-containing protein (putative c-di-GMP-specific phosphodiesterase class I)